MKSGDILFKVIADMIVFLAEREADELDDDDMLAVVEGAVAQLNELPSVERDDFEKFLVKYRASSGDQFAEGIGNLIEALEANRDT
jgi:hypothetical protein